MLATIRQLLAPPTFNPADCRLPDIFAKKATPTKEPPADNGLRLVGKAQHGDDVLTAYAGDFRTAPFQGNSTLEVPVASGAKIAANAGGVVPHITQADRPELQRRKIAERTAIPLKAIFATLPDLTAGELAHAGKVSLSLAEKALAAFRAGLIPTPEGVR